MNSVDELKPCPFCGGEAELVEVSMDYDDVPPITILNEYTVECCECGASLKIFNDVDGNVFCADRKMPLIWEREEQKETPKDMTLKEIEDKLGYPVRIVWR